MSRPYNFGPGPAQMPTEVLSKASRGLLEWKKTGMSVMELGHRGTDFREIIENVTQKAIALLNIPDTHKLLFMQGGARGQNAIVPMNLMKNNFQCDYAVTGFWSDLSANEAKKFGKVNIATTIKGEPSFIEPYMNWTVQENSSYLHFCSNETVNGVEFPEWPDMTKIQRENVPLVVDMSSNILSKPMNFNKLGLAYASAQKNVGPAGLTIVIIKESLLHESPARGLGICPKVFDYSNLIQNSSLYNTPPTFAIYVTGLMFEWLLKEGGLEEIAKKNFEKSKLLYDTIDSSDFYRHNVSKKFRSRVNVPFFLPKQDLERFFIDGANKRGLINLKGHSAVGGLRANLYNSMSMKGVKELVDWLNEFEKKYG